MITNILAADAIYGVTSHADLLAKHTVVIDRLRARGRQIQVTTNPDPQVAYIDHGRWLLQCACGSCVGAHPTWPDARCGGCFTTYTQIVWPTNQAAIEAVLVARPLLEARNWNPTETVDQLIADNLAHGLPTEEI